MHNNTKNQQNLFFVGFIFLICLFLVRKRHIYIHLFLVRKSICYKHTRSFRQKSISIYFTFLYFTLFKNVNIFLFLFTFLLFLCTLCIHFFIILIIFLKQHTTLFTEQHTTKVLSPRLTHLFTKQIRNRYDNMIFLSYP